MLIGSHLARAENSRMMPKRIALVRTVLRLERSLRAERQIVESDIQISPTTTAHNIANLGKLLVTGYRATLRKLRGLNRIGKSKTRKSHSKQQNLKP